MICKFWFEGRCNKGSACPYAHGKNELRHAGRCLATCHMACGWPACCGCCQAPEQQQRRRCRENTQLRLPCAVQVPGRPACARRCLRAPNAPTAAAAPTHVSSSPPSPLSAYAASVADGHACFAPAASNSSCRKSFAQRSLAGNCRADGGQHAADHQSELVQHPCYKTRMCKAFLQHGHCARGSACHYAHTADELRAPAAR